MESTLEKLKKEVKAVQHIKDTLDKRIEQLSKEELKYLADIPAFKKQAEDARIQGEEISKKVSVLRQALRQSDDAVKSNREILAATQKEMQELRDNSQKILDNIQEEKEESRKRILDIKNREVLCGDREKLIEKRELACNQREVHLSRDEFVLQDRIMNLAKDRAALDQELELHKSNVGNHASNVRILSEKTAETNSLREVLKSKSGDLETLIRHNEELQLDLILQKKDLADQIEKSKFLQSSLDSNIRDLENEKKRIQVLELKVKKLAHDKGLDAEIKELEEALK